MLNIIKLYINFKTYMTQKILQKKDKSVYKIYLLFIIFYKNHLYRILRNYVRNKYL